MDVCDKSGLETLLTAIPAKNTAFCSALLLFLVWLYEAEYFSAHKQYVFKIFRHLILCEHPKFFSYEALFV